MLRSDSKILVVDDYEGSHALLKQSLQELGYNNLCAASNPEEAIAALQSGQDEKQPVELVLSDLPNLASFALLERIRDRSDAREIPFIMIASESDREFVIQTLMMGDVDYIVKPLSTRTLLRKLQKISERLSKAVA